MDTRGYPLRLRLPATKVCINPVESNADFVVRIIYPQSGMGCVCAGSVHLNLGRSTQEPAKGYEHDETFLRKMYHGLLEVDVLEGTLQYPESGGLSPVSHGIPNMLLNDEETETVTLLDTSSVFCDHVYLLYDLLTRCVMCDPKLTPVTHHCVFELHSSYIYY